MEVEFTTYNGAGGGMITVITSATFTQNEYNKLLKKKVKTH